MNRSEIERNVIRAAVSYQLNGYYNVHIIGSDYGVQIFTCQDEEVTPLRTQPEMTLATFVQTVKRAVAMHADALESRENELAALDELTADQY